MLINKLKQSKTRELETENLEQDCCSETETEGHDLSPNESESSDVSCFQEARTNSVKSQSHTRVEEPKDDIPLISLLHSRKSSTNPKTAHVPDSSTEPTQALPKSMSRSTGSQETLGRKRIRVILSDDEGEMYDELECPRGRHHKVIEEDVATSDECEPYTLNL